MSKQHADNIARMDLKSSKRLEKAIAKYMLGHEVDVYSHDYRQTRTGIVRKVYGEYDEHGLQVWYVYDGNFSRAAHGTVTFTAHDVEHLGAHYASITLRKV